MFFFHIQAIVSSFELYGFLVRKTLSSSIHLVQRLLPRLLMVRSGEYLVDIQYHHRPAPESRPRPSWCCSVALVQPRLEVDLSRFPRSAVRARFG